MTRHRSLAALLCVSSAALLAACGENAVQDITGPLASARIKFFHFGVNAPGVNFYANNAKMTAISSATCTVLTATNPDCLTVGIESINGTVYGGVGSGGFYSAVAPGEYALTGKIAATVDKNLAISTVTTTIADGKSYSFYMSGIYNTTTKNVEGFVVEDPFIANFDYAVAYVRFVNAISNANPMTLYAKNTTSGTDVPVGAAVAYKGAGAFTSVPSGVYDLGARYAGVTTNAISLTGVSFSAGRIYTVGSRGDITVTSTTAATRPILQSNSNR